MRTAETYSRLLRNLLPPGKAWLAASNPGTNFGKLIMAFGEEPARVEVSQTDLMREGFADKSTAAFLLTDWEQMIGLPDECSPVLPETELERQQLVRTRLTSRGGQSEQYFIDLVESLGCTAEIIPGLKPFTCESPCDSLLIPLREVFVWRVIIDGDCDVDLVECLLKAFAPAHTVPIVEIL